MLHFPPWKQALVWAICAAGLAFAVPNLFPKASVAGWPSFVPRDQLHLGLDLQGGSHLLLEVDTEQMIKERLENVVDAARQELRTRERIGYSELGVVGREVVVAVLNAADRDRAATAVRGLAVQITSPATGMSTPDIQVTTRPDGRIAVTLTEPAIRERKRAAVDQSIEIVRRRIDQTGVSEPIIARQGEERILIQLPGVDDPDRIKRLLGKTAKMTFHLVDTTTPIDSVRPGREPPGLVLMEADAREARFQSRYLVQKRVMVSGENLTDAQPTFQDGQPVVSFAFDSSGARRFGDVTRENVGRPFAIVLDGKVISAPVIRDAILGGRGIISGSFSVQAAHDLALLLRAGALPAPLKIIEERSVGPGLGADSIRSGLIAGMIGAGGVLGFMFLSYGPLFGGLANLALAINVAMILGVMSALGATLTLPGIAGLVLTIGMAVDANVLIFERIREELRGGKTPIAAIEAGYHRAWTTILDSNLTTLLANALLFQFGAGPVRGFAVVISIGIITSMFTAVVVVRLLTVYWLKRRRLAALAL
ncbi:MAG: protein translocase subunit SecD [Alphaproteobacteria bacterium]|nr:protein translocase subunit SecD [Alphaproteobacteria bacterium]